MNKIFLIGNLTRDPELTETASGVSVCRFTIAVSRAYANGEGERQTDFFNCTAWRGLADNIARYCKKGNKVAVTGSIQIRSYEDNQGIKRMAVDIIAQDCEFLFSRAKGEQEDFYGAPAQGRSSDRRSTEKPTLREFDDDGNIPF